jgi:transcription initiation factor IIE alpha subunit
MKHNLECEIECPHCGKAVAVFKNTEILEPSVKAVKEISYSASKVTSRQGKIDAQC